MTKIRVRDAVRLSRPRFNGRVLSSTPGATGCPGCGGIINVPTRHRFRDRSIGYEICPHCDKIVCVATRELLEQSWVDLDTPPFIIALPSIGSSVTCLCSMKVSGGLIEEGRRGYVTEIRRPREDPGICGVVLDFGPIRDRNHGVIYPSGIVATFPNALDPDRFTYTSPSEPMSSDALYSAREALYKEASDVHHSS